MKSVFTGSPATTEEQTHNVNNANGNTPSAGAVFNRKYGTTAPMITTSQGMGTSGVTVTETPHL